MADAINVADAMSGVIVIVNLFGFPVLLQYFTAILIKDFEQPYYRRMVYKQIIY